MWFKSRAWKLSRSTVLSLTERISFSGKQRRRSSLAGLSPCMQIQRSRGCDPANGESRNFPIGWPLPGHAKVDLGRYKRAVEDLNMENVRLLLEIDNARLAADDYNHKLEAEQAVCDSVQKDTLGLRKMIDDTNFLRLKLEGDLESFREELAHLRKSHKEEVEVLDALVANSDITEQVQVQVQVQVDNPQKNDLSETIAEIRTQYEKVAEQNRADTENWYKTKFDSMSQEAAMNTQALEEAKSRLTELRRQMQGLELERQTLQKMVETLENTLKSTGDHYCNDMANLNRVIAKLQDELAACRADLERQARESEALLDIKTKLENEIELYGNLIEGATVRHQETDN